MGNYLFDALNEISEEEDTYHTKIHGYSLNGYMNFKNK